MELKDKLDVVITQEQEYDDGNDPAGSGMYVNVISKVMGQDVYLTGYALEESLMEAYEAFAGLLKSNSLNFIIGSSDVDQIVKAKEEEINIFRKEHGNSYAEMFITMMKADVDLKEAVDCIIDEYSGIID